MIMGEENMEQFTQLIERVKKGDAQAFELLYQQSYRQVYYTCMSFLKNEQNVYDMMQETYITALTRISSLESPERFMAWLSQIAVNKCKDFLRKKPHGLQIMCYIGSLLFC